VPSKYPSLTLTEVRSILICWEFVERRRRSGSSHVQWEKKHKGITFVVTLDDAISEFDDFLLKVMIEQSGLKRDQFDAGSRSAARKIGVDPLLHAR